MLKTVVCVRFHCGRGFFHEYAAASASHHMNITYLLVLAATEFRKGLVLIQQLCFGSCCCCFFFRLLLHQFRFNIKKKKRRKKSSRTALVSCLQEKVRLHEVWPLSSRLLSMKMFPLFMELSTGTGENRGWGGLDFVLWPQCQDMNFSGDIWGKLDEIPPWGIFCGVTSSCLVETDQPPAPETHSLWPQLSPGAETPRCTLKWTDKAETQRCSIFLLLTVKWTCGVAAAAASEKTTTVNPEKRQLYRFSVSCSHRVWRSGTWHLKYSPQEMTNIMIQIFMGLVHFIFLLSIIYFFVQFNNYINLTP